ncbi:hypothetical protein GGQ85_003512 [Nitrobacter vulgaris]|nr:hypothetical protein [Nitrobacter vulgaris]
MHPFVIEQGRAYITCRRDSWTHSLSTNSGRTAHQYVRINLR